MAKTFTPPDPLGKRGWRIKIRDRERVEPPHVTILFKTKAWRWGLRERRFLDTEPEPAQVPQGLVEYLHEVLPELIAAWDETYPGNKVSSEEEKDGDA